VTALPLRGRILRARSSGEHALEYFAYCPASAAPEAPLLVAVHGYSRNAAEQVERWAPLCDATGVVLAAPHFDAERFRTYQVLGAGADHALDALVAESRRNFSMLLGSVALAGFSGGGQFVHRYAMAHPKRVASAAVIASGWFTYPGRELEYPFGTRCARQQVGARMRAEAFLRVPMLVAVGEHDDASDAENLRHSKRLDAQQGASRLERATRWVKAMHDAAAAANCAPRVRLALVPNAAHSFADCMDNGLGELVFAHAGITTPAARAARKRLTALA
jgi:pimeloyl-ACP methyl ester carboxylesterase